MFDLEHAISEWRRAMLSAGIQSPDPLEELEIHLREEIDQHKKAGMDAAEVFSAAVESLGQGHVLQKEFKKVETRHKTVRAILLIFGWLAATCTLLYGILVWEFDWNFFSFHPRFDASLIFALFAILAGLTAIWFLAKASRDKTNHIVSLLLCILIGGIAVSALHADEHATGIFGGHYEIPIWYRASRTLVFCIPGLFWICWTRRHSAQKLNPIES